MWQFELVLLLLVLAGVAASLRVLVRELRTATQRRLSRQPSLSARVVLARRRWDSRRKTRLRLPEARPAVTLPHARAAAGVPSAHRPTH